MWKKALSSFEGRVSSPERKDPASSPAGACRHHRPSAGILPQPPAAADALLTDLFLGDGRPHNGFLPVCVGFRDTAQLNPRSFLTSTTGEGGPPDGRLPVGVGFRDAAQLNPCRLSWPASRKSTPTSRRPSHYRPSQKKKRAKKALAAPGCGRMPAEGR